MELNLHAALRIPCKCNRYSGSTLGREAVRYAPEGGSGEMACLRRVSDAPYASEVFFIPVDQVLNRVKKVPDEWINEEGNDITQK